MVCRDKLVNIDRYNSLFRVGVRVRIHVKFSWGFVGYGL